VYLTRLRQVVLVCRPFNRQPQHSQVPDGIHTNTTFSQGCRVILNMQRLKTPAQRAHTNDVQLTTAGFESAESETYQMKSLKPPGVNRPHQSGVVETLVAEKEV